MESTAIPYRASNEIRAQLRQISRTEDLKFSPDGKTLAIAAFSQNKIILLGLNYASSGPVTEIELTHCTELQSDEINKPHGLAFLGPNHLLVASREGVAGVFELPPLSGAAQRLSLRPSCFIPGGRFSPVESPGSVCSYAIGQDRFRVLICCNYIHRVSSHVLDINKTASVAENRYLLSKNLRVPDGIAISNNHQWIAISNHLTGEILVYDASQKLTTRSVADGVLQGTVCPHGLRFTKCGQYVISADAGSPYLHVHGRKQGSWKGIHQPLKSIPALDQSTFDKGHSNSGEGGLKGIDLDPTDRVLASTCEQRVLAFHDLQAVLKMPPQNDTDDLSAYYRERGKFTQPPASRMSRGQSFVTRVGRGLLGKTKTRNS